MNWAPPAAREEVIALFHGTLAVGTAGGADVYGDAVVLGDGGEAREQPVGANLHDAGHVVEPPAARRPTEAAQDGSVVTRYWEWK